VPQTQSGKEGLKMTISIEASTHSHSTMRVPESDNRDECVLIAMKRAEGMLRGYAKSHELDFEDLYQDCAELMLRVWERMPADVQSEVGYLYGAVRLEMRLIVKRLDKESLHPISLDVPLFGDDEPETLKDVIPNRPLAE
jgi:hypothetical protein